MLMNRWEEVTKTILVLASAAIAVEVPIVEAVAQTPEPEKLPVIQASTPTPAIALEPEPTASVETSPIEFSQDKTNFFTSNSTDHSPVESNPSALADGFLSPIASASLADLTEVQPSDSMTQVTSVSSLSDVQPNDWAFQALQSLVERYGCIAGYPDGTFRGNRSLSRYEFAAGVNACLNRIEELITAATEDLVTQEDLALLQRLQEEFQAELITLRGRVDELEVHNATLEANQFSTTTKLSGVANFVISSAFSGEGDTETVLQNRVRLLFTSSFTGKDLLVTRFALGNGTIPELAGGTREVVQATQWYGNFNNLGFLVTLDYIFPVNDKLTALVAANGGLHADYAPTLNPFDDYDAGTTSLSVFSGRNAIYRLGGGTGIGLQYRLNNAFTLSAGYLSGDAFSPRAGDGLFNGNNSALAQITWNPNQNLSLGLTYNHAYFGTGSFGFGDNSATFGLGAYTGTGVVNNTLAQFPTATDSYGAQASWKVNSNFILSGWVGFTKVRAIGVGDGEVWNYALTLAFPDLGKKGNLGGLIIGAEPYLASLEGVDLPANDTPIHIEGFYKFQLSDHISVTPGVIWLTAPNQNANNEDVVLGTIRTTFTF